MILQKFTVAPQSALNLDLPGLHCLYIYIYIYIYIIRFVQVCHLVTRWYWLCEPQMGNGNCVITELLPVESNLMF